MAVIKLGKRVRLRKPDDVFFCWEEVASGRFSEEGRRQTRRGSSGGL